MCPLCVAGWAAAVACTAASSVASVRTAAAVAAVLAAAPAVAAPVVAASAGIAAAGTVWPAGPAAAHVLSHMSTDLWRTAASCRPVVPAARPKCSVYSAHSQSSHMFADSARTPAGHTSLGLLGFWPLPASPLPTIEAAAGRLPASAGLRPAT